MANLKAHVEVPFSLLLDILTFNLWPIAVGLQRLAANDRLELNAEVAALHNVVLPEALPPRNLAVLPDDKTGRHCERCLLRHFLVRLGNLQAVSGFKTVTTESMPATGQRL